jgi:hypothetical protein
VELVAVVVLRKQVLTVVLQQQLQAVKVEMGLHLQLQEVL